MQHPFQSNPALDTGPAPLATFPGAYRTHLSCAQLLGLFGLALTGYELWNQDFILIWFGVFMLVAAALTYARSQTLKAYCVKIFLHGFSVEKGNTKMFGRWDEVESFTQKIVQNSINFVPVSTTYNYKVLLRTGQSWYFTNTTQRVEEMGINFQNAVRHALLPRLVEEFKRGETVHFGPLSFNQTGITYGRTTVTWAEYSSLDFSSGYLRVHKHKNGARGVLTGGTIVLHAAGLPNLYTLVAFMQAIGKSA